MVMSVPPSFSIIEAGWLICCFMQGRFLLAYALAPTGSPLDQAKDLTTVVLLKVENDEVHFVESKVLPGEGMVAVMQQDSS